MKVTVNWSIHRKDACVDCLVITSCTSPCEKAWDIIVNKLHELLRYGGDRYVKGMCEVNDTDMLSKKLIESILKRQCPLCQYDGVMRFYPASPDEFDDYGSMDEIVCEFCKGSFLVDRFNSRLLIDQKAFRPRKDLIQELNYEISFDKFIEIARNLT